MARQYTKASSEYSERAGAVIEGSPMSVSAWFYADQLPNTAGDEFTLWKLGFKSTSTNRIQLRIQDDAGANQDKLELTWVSSNAFSAGAISANTWHHSLAVNASDASHIVYLDGAAGSEDTTDETPDLSTGSRFTWIGANYHSAVQDHMDGRIAEVAMWSAGLTVGEAAILAAGYSPLFVRPQNLVAYWPLIRDVAGDGTGNDNDIVGNNVIAPFNTPTIGTHPRVIKPHGIWTPHKGVAAAPTGGQVIRIIMSKLIIPSIYLKQGKANRRDFMKNTFLASLGIK